MIVFSSKFFFFKLLRENQNVTFLYQASSIPTFGCVQVPPSTSSSSSSWWEFDGYSSWWYMSYQSVTISKANALYQVRNDIKRIYNSHIMKLSACTFLNWKFWYFVITQFNKKQVLPRLWIFVDWVTSYFDGNQVKLLCRPVVNIFQEVKSQNFLAACRSVEKRSLKGHLIFQVCILWPACTLKSLHCLFYDQMFGSEGLRNWKSLNWYFRCAYCG